MNIDTQIILLPSEVSDSRHDTLICILKEIHSGRGIILDFSRVVKISPAGFAILQIIVDASCEHQTFLDFINISSSLSFCGKLKNILEIKKNTAHFLRMEDLSVVTSTSINIGKVGTIAPEFSQMVEDRFLKVLGEEKTWNINLVCNELMQNAVDHSSSERYFLYAGINGSDFEFGVLDRGVTIPAKMATKYQQQEDFSYINEALKLGVGTRRTRVGGMGLYYMFENIKDMKGKLVIESRYGHLRRHFNARKVNSSRLKNPLWGSWCMGRISLER
jgi:anti-sigma regulatory factor (Ser/Thr protein kinase)